MTVFNNTFAIARALISIIIAYLCPIHLLYIYLF